LLYRSELVANNNDDDINCIGGNQVSFTLST